MTEREIAHALDAAVSAGLRRDTAEHIVRMRHLGVDPGIGLTPDASMHPDLAVALKTPKDNEPDLEPGSADTYWPLIDDAAFYGLAGEVVRIIDPHTEADRVAILIQLLTYFGNIVGRNPHYRVEGDYHRSNIYAVLVGDTSKGRKGTSAGRVRSIVRHADERWVDERIKNGLSSGEGLINEVRDERQIFNSTKQVTEVVDLGVADKRLLVAEAEFANALTVMERAGNNLSPVIRAAWEGLTLSTMTKNSPLSATGGHISIVGHITTDELRRRLNRTEVANGFANRFMRASFKAVAAWRPPQR
jgi:hypothetical protein